MQEIVRTNDEVLLSFLQSLLKDAGIDTLVADRNMSAVEGSIGMLPRRLLVPEDCHDRARRIIEDADLGQWIFEP